jgi:hypothetical protein
MPMPTTIPGFIPGCRQNPGTDCDLADGQAGIRKYLFFAATSV